ncbi:hypothetical protein T492DRAFT_831334 [Pavlovales sp. CCMP2436]|nr:hypothetical protein T492DRAFT_831334 [Pavlovales sp. CCMP2436]
MNAAWNDLEGSGAGGSAPTSPVRWIRAQPGRVSMGAHASYSPYVSAGNTPGVARELFPFTCPRVTLQVSLASGRASIRPAALSDLAAAVAAAVGGATRDEQYEPFAGGGFPNSLRSSRPDSPPPPPPRLSLGCKKLIPPPPAGAITRNPGVSGAPPPPKRLSLPFGTVPWGLAGLLGSPGAVSRSPGHARRFISPGSLISLGSPSAVPNSTELSGIRGFAVPGSPPPPPKRLSLPFGAVRKSPGESGAAGSSQLSLDAAIPPENRALRNALGLGACGEGPGVLASGAGVRRGRGVGGLEASGQSAIESGVDSPSSSLAELMGDTTGAFRCSQAFLPTTITNTSANANANANTFDHYRWEERSGVGGSSVADLEELEPFKSTRN